MLISSRSNERVKEARSLRESKFRRATGLHFIEGDKVVGEALTSGAEVTTVFCREGTPAPRGGFELLEVTEGVMEALCTGTPQNLCALVRTPVTAPPEEYRGLIVVLEQLQDPGNVGTILRTADALGGAGVLLSADSADPFAPKTLRASMGSAYHLPVYIGDVPTELKRMKEQGYTCLCGHLRGSENMPPIQEKMALVVGNEGQGVSRETAELCTLYRLPMAGRAESLNAAVFAAIMLYELTRR